jgi:hypothetical protein
MRDIDIFSEHQRRHLVHVYAALREHIMDELEYDRSPDFEPLDAKAIDKLGQVIYTELTALMYAAHAEEATTLEVQCAEAAERLKVEGIATTWRLDVGDANADWLDDLDKDGQR